jgi:glycosyltransferase involved in cell wall biosynthesis
LQDNITPVVVLFEDGPLKTELERRNIEVHIFKASNALVTSRKESLARVSPELIQRGMASVNTALSLSQLIRKLNVDLVHTNNLKACLIGGVAARLARKPLIWHVHDRISADYLPQSMVSLVRTMAKVMPTAVVANSVSTLATLKLNTSKRNTVIYPGVKVGEPPVHKSWTHPVRIGIVGRLSEWKGQHIFLEVAARVIKDYPSTEWVIVGAALFGEDAYSEQLKARAAEPDLKGHVIFRGFQSDVVTEMRNLDIVMHCSISPEPFGQVITEALALQKPVIATGAGGVLEIIEDRQSGLLVEMGNIQDATGAVNVLLANPLIAKVLGENGRLRVLEHITINQSATAALELYADLVPSKSDELRCAEGSVECKLQRDKAGVK